LKFPQNKKAVIAFITILFLLILVLLLSRRNLEDSKVIPTAKVSPDIFAVNVNAVGEIDSEKSITISSNLREEGKIIFLIEDGTHVKKGAVLVKFDQTLFEEKVTQLNSKVKEWNTIVAAQQQTLEWEKIQSQQKISNAGYDNQVAVLELQKMEKGEGPLELSRLEEAVAEKKKNYEELKGYIKDLEDFKKKGYSNPMEVALAKERVEQLKKSYEVSQQKYDSYKNYILPTQIKTAKAKVEKTSMNIDQTRMGEGFKIGKAIAELNKSKQGLLNYKNLLEDANKEIEKTIIVAPQAGLAILKEAYWEGEMRKPRVGDNVIRNQPILFLPDISFMLVKVLIREVDLYKINLEKPAEIRIDAYPDLLFQGEVSNIGVVAEKRREVSRGEKYFKVYVSMKGSDKRLRPGMTARVKITSLPKSENVLTVPVNAVFQENKKNYCYIAKSSGFEMREVLLGIQNDVVVQVLKRVKEGEMICLSRPPLDLVKRKH